jgi:predicted lipoprotein with Yx(FWY)xxD motif
MELKNRSSVGRRTTRQRAHTARWTVLATFTTLGAAIASTAAGSAPASAARAPDGNAPTTIVIEKTTWGPILALSSGWTVYRFVKDSNNRSACFGDCLTAWPAVLLAHGQKEADSKGVSHLGFIVRSGGARQVTYEGIPLYLFIGDKKAGQINGNVKDKFGQWWVVNPADPKSVPHQAGGTTTTAGGSGVAY